MIKLHAVSLQLHEKRGSSDYIHINSSEEELTNKTVYYDTEINSCMTEVPII